MSQASQDITQQFKDGGVIANKLVGQDAVSKTYVDTQDAVRDVNIAAVATGNSTTLSSLNAHISNTNVHVNTTDKSNWNAHVADAIIHVTQADHAKLNGIATGAEVNQNTFSKVNDISATSKTDTLTVEGGTGITVSTNPATKKVIVSATGDVTPGAHGISHNDDGPDPIPDLVNIKSQLAETANARTGLNQQALINFNFDIWQRSASSNMNTPYIADRWHNVLTSSDTNPSVLTVSRREVENGEMPNSKNYMRVDVVNPGSNLVTYSRCNIIQDIENGARYLAGAGKKVTFSFWARSNIVGKKIGVNIHQGYGSGGSPSTYENIYGRYWVLTTEWVKYTHTFTTNTLAGKVFGTNNDDTLSIQLWLMWGDDYKVRFNTDAETFRSAGYIDFAQTQFCSGETSLPFQPKSYADELRDCQRYFRKGKINFSFSNVDKIYTAMTGFKETMRIKPTLTFGEVRGAYNSLVATTVTANFHYDDMIKSVGLSDLPTLNQDISIEVSADAEIG